MESQPQNPEYKINPENFHPWSYTKFKGDNTIERKISKFKKKKNDIFSRTSNRLL